MIIQIPRNELIIVNTGPHYPSMHGVLRLIVILDGEEVTDCEPILGYLHRGMKKIAENRTIIQYLRCEEPSSNSLIDLQALKA